MNNMKNPTSTYRVSEEPYFSGVIPALRRSECQDAVSVINRRFVVDNNHPKAKTARQVLKFCNGVVEPFTPKVFTYCDFGTAGRKSEIGCHKTIASAMRQYARIWNVYGRGRDEWKVWQEMNKDV